MSRPALFGLFLLALLSLLALAGNPPVQRTQEARVLETARQMLPTSVDGWLIPRLNGKPRLQKPPLAYWMAAGSFKLLGVTDFAGRLPFLLCGWLLLAVLFISARHLFDESTATIACLLTLGSYLFFRYTRLAETDAPAALFVTIAITAITLAASLATVGRMGRKEIATYHLAAVAIALAALAKGGPIVFPLLFLLFASVATRKNLVWRFLRSGAPITLLLIALPWYVYAIQTHGWQTFRHEMQNNLEGGDHGMPAYEYIPWLAMALLPWTLFTLLGAIGVGQTLWRGFRTAKTRPDIRDAESDRPDRLAMRTFGDFTEESPPVPITAMRELKLLTAWILAIAIPLTLTGNKQLHYLLPLVPPLMIVTAWFIRQAIVPSAQKHVRIFARVALILMMTGMIAAGLFSLLQIVVSKHHPPADAVQPVAATAILVSVLVIGVSFAVSLRSAFYLLIAVSVLAMPLLTGYSAPLLDQQDPRWIASEITAIYTDSPLAFYGPNVSLPLCYNLRREILSVSDKSLPELLKAQPRLVLIAQDKAGRTPAAPPPPFVQDWHPIVTDDQTFTFYRVP